MRLLLRANAHRRPAPGVWELASSPDTPDREPWCWDVRLVDSGAAPTDARGRGSELRLSRSGGLTSVLTVRSDPATVDPTLQALDVGTPVSVDRDEQELLVLVVGRGVAGVEGRHLLRECDAMVLEGNGPYSVRIEAASAGPVTLGLVRLRPSGAGSIAWVP